MDNEGVKIPLRLHVHKETHQVIFAEANSDFVDTLFSFLTLPMGTVVRILKNQCDLQPGEIGCFGSLYESLEKLDVSHLWSEGCKTMLLNPRNAAEAWCQQLKLNIDDSVPYEYYICQSWFCTKPEISINIPAEVPAAVCSCGETLSKTTNILKNENTGTRRAFVADKASFIVTDDLHVIPNLPTTVFKMFEKFGISDLNAVDEITLNIGNKEMLTLLKCSVQSNSPLTDAFVSKRSNLRCLVKPSLENFEIGNSFANEIGKVEEATENAMTIKLVIQKSNGRVLFSHAEENFVDFLFSLLAIPLGGVSRILSGNISYTSVGNLYNSLLTLNVDRHLKSQSIKSMLVNPPVAALHLSKNNLFSFSETEANYYRYATKYVQFHKETRMLYLALYKVSCPRGETCLQLLLKDPKFEGQYTRPSMFIVTDDMHVSPLSSFSVVSYLRKQGIPLSDIKEQDMSIGLDEARRILKASFESTSVFTNAGITIMPKHIKPEQP